MSAQEVFSLKKIFAFIIVILTLFTITSCEINKLQPLDWDKPVAQKANTENNDQKNDYESKIINEMDMTWEQRKSSQENDATITTSQENNTTITTSQEEQKEKEPSKNDNTKRNPKGNNRKSKTTTNKQHLKQINVWGDRKDEVLLVTSDEFQEKNPDIKVNIIDYGRGDLYTHLLSAVATGKTPDVLMLDHTYATGLGEKGFITDLTKLGANNIKNKFVASCWDAVTLNKKVYGLPYISNTIAMAYNRRLIERATGSDKIPRTYDEIISMSKQVNLEENIYFFPTPFLFNSNTSFLTGIEHFYSWLWGHGGEILNSTNTKAAFNSSAGVEAIRKIIEIGKTQKITNNDRYLEASFNDGRACFNLMGTWSMRSYNGEKQFEISPMPTLEKGKKAYSTLGLLAYCITEKSNLKEESYKFIQSFCLDDTIQRKIARMGSHLPVTKSALEDSFYKTQNDWNVFIEQQKLSKSRPGIKEWPEIEIIIADAVRQTILENKNIKSTLDKAAINVNNLLKSRK